MSQATIAKKSTRPSRAKAVQVPDYIVIEHKDTRLELSPGTYKKVTTRTGKAFLSVGTDGSLTYTNRRREERVLLAKEFCAIFATGISTKVA
ncbi:MAG: hypothetical protein QOE51_1608 [Actinoplanes sp.]|nr:hypothetical protein [Actinoplanes sp.]